MLSQVMKLVKMRGDQGLFYAFYASIVIFVVGILTLSFGQYEGLILVVGAFYIMLSLMTWVVLNYVTQQDE